MFSKAIAISALAASASAHIVLTYPKPFGWDTLNSSPLAPADFPCKQRNGVYAVDTMNQWNAGETQNITFGGTAVHGGGSCQFSITTDPEPTEKSQWKVIQSVVGGCPTAKTNENFEEIPGKDPRTIAVPDEFPVTMPSDIPEGRYTFAWTWINKVGNREFYMNCAPIQVGSSGSTASTASAAKALAALPDMFVANLPDTECKAASGNFVYPDPGSKVMQLKQEALINAVSGAACQKQNALGAGAGSIGSPSAGTPSTPSEGTPSTPSDGGYPTKPSSGVPSESPINKGPTESKAPLNPGGVFAPGASSVPVSKPTPQPEAPAPAPAPQPEVPAPQPAPAAPSAAPQVPNNTTPTNGECTPCTNDGAVVCIGSKKFGLCNRGCAVAQDLAEGMMCSAGAVVATTKRNIHFPRAHLHRRHSAAHLI
ncbi:hypothetical protein HBH56_119000 [Parastagonospora nodorum]|uniref:Chitin-binding type-4 domain-containing protein n=1 Tax=Phaeosphaeria nodorum (strain SN15 / ATCC MYA-4574 / FGSC 10173) TaxID=321614 RepID=A0A7U2NP14_PHANO|nr:hypothetical protein HBH56_119000 [Parastagonospora nodorum]QRD05338.1 hypothetical protein JI435_112320 [Parastagonospora nodorum SN15]KAH3928963.1 hypothetical protein HBH54_130200 [Parastagonospora nodorum]KAH3959810.1 hypothetical protein HBH51_197390 [Parastagonospora nodorum]KAH3998488.1 hypothetical protein HBI10_128290 [Parastagonospora nodorum]